MENNEYYPISFYEKIYSNELKNLFPIINTVEIFEGSHITDYVLQVTYTKVYSSFNPEGLCRAIAWYIKDINEYLSISPTFTVRVFMDDEFKCGTFTEN